MRFITLFNKILILSVLLKVLLFPIAYAQETASPVENMEDLNYANGTILKILKDIQDPDVSYLNKEARIQTVEIEITSGELQGKKYIVENRTIGNQAYDILLKKGSKVVVNIEYFTDQQKGSPIIHIADLNRFPATVLLLSAFLLIILFIGGKIGVKTIFSLTTTFGLVFYLFIPQVHQGVSPIWMAVILSTVATAITMSTICGLNIKAYAATIGTVGGVLIAALFSQITVLLAPLSGIYDESSIFLISAYPNIDPQSILIAGMIIAALGAAMDVAISIASAMHEIYEANPSRPLKELFISGMNVGRDIMGTMTNTLILAYAGSALPLFVLLFNMPLIKVLNLNSVTTEATAAIAGSIGLILTIPITAITFIFLLKIQAKKMLT